MATGSDGNDNLTGTSGGDTIYAAGGNDTVHAGFGADTVDGGSGSDLIYGEDGDDLLYGGQDDSADTLYGGAGADTLVGATGTEMLDGGDGDDAIGVGEGNQVFGGLGDDYLQINEGGSPIGRAVIDGGGGIDFVDFFYHDPAAEIWIDQVSATGFELHNIEALGLGGPATVHGGAGADFVFCQGPGALIVGAAGDDTLAGHFGNDSLSGGAGDDLLATGEGGHDHLDAGAGDDVILIGGDSFTINGGAGFDIIDMSANEQRGVVVMGRDGDLVVAGVEEVLGSAFDDYMRGAAGDETLIGAAGDDYFILSRGHDLIDGGDGVDKVDVMAFKSSLVDLAMGFAQLPDGSTTTFTSIESVFFGLGDDTVKAASATGHLDGGEGGIDTVSFEHLDGGIVASLQDGTVRLADGTASGEILHFDRLIGSDFADTLYDFGDFTHQRATLDGGAGDDLLNAGAAGNTYIGGAGRDTLTFADNHNTLTVDFGSGKIALDWETAHFSGVEWVIGSAQSDTFFAGQGGSSSGGDGGDGDDTFSFAHAKAGVTFTYGVAGPQDTGGAGIVQIVNFERLGGSRYGDHLSTAVACIVSGGDGDDVLDASRAPSAVLSGDGGDDTLIGSKGDDFLGGGDGFDTVSYAAAKSAVKIDLNVYAGETGQGKDIYDRVEVIAGSKFGDTFTGDDFANGFDGAAGNDTFYGGEGADTLTGGSGKDVFIYKSNIDSLGATHDLITDLEKSDVIDLSRIDADTTHGGDQAFHLVKHLSGYAGEAALVYDADKDQTSLLLDFNGDGSADAMIAMAGDQTRFTNFVL